MKTRKNLIEVAKRAIAVIGDDSSVPMEQTVEELEELQGDIEARLEVMYAEIKSDEEG